MKRKSLLRRNFLPSYSPFIEPLEDRFALDATAWAQFAGNAQHTSISNFASQPLEAVHWSSAVDNFPQSRAAHYGGPLVTAANTVIYPFKTNIWSDPSPNFHIIARNGNDGSLLWDESTDWIPAGYNWYPQYQPVHVPSSNRVYFPGLNGSLFYKDNVDTASGVSTKVQIYAGVAGNETTTGLTADNAGNIYYGYRNGTAGGIVKVTPAGVVTIATANTFSQTPAFTDWIPQRNHTPALSNDGLTLYTTIRRSGDGTNGRLIGLSTANLTTQYNSGLLKDPRNGNGASITGDSTASPMVGPDGHVFLGVQGNPYNGSRGWMLHFNADLTNLNLSTPLNLTDTYVPGGFGWDTTPSIVPASMVPQYTGSSSYLIFTKYNNYVTGSTGGDGSNAIGVLDPYDSEVLVGPALPDSGGVAVMKRVLYQVGPTPDWDVNLTLYPNAVREWCINYGAVDPATNSIIVNSADGNFYRWHLPSDTLIEPTRLSSGIGQPYTMTVVGVDGTMYGIQIGQIFALGQTPRMSISDAVFTEGTGGSTTATFTVSLNYPRTTAITVNYATNDGTAIAGSDYTTASGALTFNPGQKTKTISVTVNPDSVYELNETFFVNLSSISNAVLLDGQGQGTVNNDDVQPSLTIANVSANEGNSGTTSFVFTVNLSAASGVTTTVNYASANGTATSGTDYTSTSGTLTFNPGETSKTVTVSVLGDTLFEVNDTFFVNLSGAVNATISDSQALGTILNDDNVPGISITDASVTEGGLVTFEVTLSSISSQTVTVNYTTSNGSATAGSDYVATSGTLTFTAGSTSVEITVITTNDSLDELAETFFFDLSNATNASISDAQGLGTINDNDPQPTVSLGDVSANEGSSGTTSFMFTVALSTASGRSVTVNYATANGTATIVDNDYQTSSGTVTFAIGEVSRTITVLVNGDSVNESNENFFVNLSAGNGATILDSQGVGTILNDDLFVISVNDVTLAEGDSGTTSFVFTVSMPSASAGTVSIDYAIADGSATTAGSDYVGGIGTVTFNPGEVSKIITVLVNADLLNEMNETFFVDLSNPVGATIGDNQGLGTINNDDLLPSISVNDAIVPELDYNTGTVTVYVMLSAPSGQTVNVAYETSNGTASSTILKDYTDTFGTLTFIPGQTVASFDVSIFGDTRSEPDETIRVLLSSPVNSTISDGLGIITIIDDDIVYVTITGTSVTEGNSGQTTAVVTVDLSIPADYDITIEYTTADVTATVGSDYLFAWGVLTFPAGSTSQTISLQVLGDLLVEPNEAFEVVLYNATPGVELGIYPEADVDIVDDDTIGISISDVSVTEGNSGSKLANFTVSLSQASGQSITVKFATQNGTANGIDYQPNIANLTFSPGQTSKTVSISVFGDTKIELNETFFVNLSVPVNATITDGQGVGTIVNDDGLAMLREISINNFTVTEGGVASFTVVLSSSSSQVITVNYATANGVAIAGSDFTAASGMLTFNPGEVSKQVTVSTIDDMTSETSESFFVNLSAATNSMISDGQGLGTILDNDIVLPSFSISDVSQLEGNSGLTPFVFTVTRSSPNTVISSVRFGTANGTANGIDYQPNIAVLTFNPGETTKTITINVFGDTTVEANQTFFVNLSMPVNATITDSQGMGTILNDDFFVVEISTQSSAPLANMGQAQLPVTSRLPIEAGRFNSLAQVLPDRLDSRGLAAQRSAKSWPGDFLALPRHSAEWAIEQDARGIESRELSSAVSEWTNQVSSQKIYVLSDKELSSDFL